MGSTSVHDISLWAVRQFTRFKWPLQCEEQGQFAGRDLPVGSTSVQKFSNSEPNGPSSVSKGPVWFLLSFSLKPHVDITNYDSSLFV